MYGSPSWRRLTPLLLLLVLGAVLPQFLPQYFLYLGNVLMMYAVLALGLDLLLGWAGQFAFAHIAFFGVGAYATTIFQTRLGIPFVLAALFVEPFAAFLSRFRRHLGMIEKVMGALLVLTGTAFLTGWITRFSFWLLETFPALGRIG